MAQRDFISIGEVVRTIEYLIDKRSGFQKDDIFNLASGVSITLEQLRCKVEKLIGCKIDFTEEEAPEDLIIKSLISISKLEGFLGRSIAGDMTALETYILSII